RPLRYPHAIAEQRHFLIVDGDDDLQRTFRHVAKACLLIRLGLSSSRGRNPRLARHWRGRRIPPVVPSVGEAHPAHLNCRREQSKPWPPPARRQRASDYGGQF